MIGIGAKDILPIIKIDQDVMMTANRFLLALVLGAWMHSALAEDLTGSSVPSDLQTLKENVLDLNQQLTQLEDELLYPSSESALYISIEVGSTVRLVDINVLLDGQHVAYHFYTPQEYAALTKGGMDRIFNGNISTGSHEIKAIITGYDPLGKSFQRVMSYQFVKGRERKFIELHISDDANKSQAEFIFHDWGIKH